MLLSVGGGMRVCPSCANEWYYHVYHVLGDDKQHYYWDQAGESTGDGEAYDNYD